MPTTHTIPAVELEAFEVTAANVADNGTWPAWVTAINDAGMSPKNNEGEYQIYTVTTSYGVFLVFEDDYLYAAATDGDPEIGIDDPITFGDKAEPVAP